MDDIGVLVCVCVGGGLHLRIPPAEQSNQGSKLKALQM